MRLIKNVIGTLEVDPKAKKIWLNSLGKCVLRMGNLNFIGKFENEKFSAIDGTPTGIILCRDKGDETSEKFIPSIISLVGFFVSMIESGKIQDVRFFEHLEKEISKIVSKNLEDRDMSILNDLLNELRSDDSDETLKKFCDKIYEEEKKKYINHPEFLPTGPNVFLALECPEDFQRYNFICLEREEKNKFIVSHWAVTKNTEVAKRIRVWDCRGLPNNKIVDMFLEKYNFLRGK